MVVSTIMTLSCFRARNALIGDRELELDVDALPGGGARVARWRPEQPGAGSRGGTGGAGWAPGPARRGVPAEPVSPAACRLSPQSRCSPPPAGEVLTLGSGGNRARSRVARRLTECWSCHCFERDWVQTRQPAWSTPSKMAAGLAPEREFTDEDWRDRCRLERWAVRSERLGSRDSSGAPIRPAQRRMPAPRLRSLSRLTNSALVVPGPGPFARRDRFGHARRLLWNRHRRAFLG